MAIQVRRGLWANLDTSKLVAGEPVCGTDAGVTHVGIAKAPSDLVELATKDDIANVGHLTVDGTKLKWVNG